MDGDGSNGQWLTYDQVADVRGTSRDAAIRWVQRRKLRRQLGNDGRVLVLVPPNVVADVGAPRTPQRIRSDVPDVGDNAPPSAPPDMVEVWRAAIDALRSQLVRADQREDAFRAELEQARIQIRNAEETARMAQEAAEAMQTTIDELKVGQALMVDRHATELAQAQEAIESAQRDAKTAQAELAVAGLFADQAHAAAEEARQAAAARIAGLEAATQALAAQAEADADRARGVVQEAVQAAETLRTSIDELKAGQVMMQDTHARELAVAQHDAQEGQQAAAELRRAEAERKARGRWARLRAAWRGE